MYIIITNESISQLNTFKRILKVAVKFTNQVIIMAYYLQGLTIGLAYLAPIGMQNVFLINTALTQKQRKALLTAVIVMFFDLSLALACFFGIGRLVERFQGLRLGVLVVGGLLVMYIGVNLFKAKASLEIKHDVVVSLSKTITTACVVTWCNPQAIIDGTMMLGAFQATLPQGAVSSFLLGLTSASGLWFLGLTMFVSSFSERFNVQVLQRINKVCGVVITCYGLKLLVEFVRLLP